MPSGGWGTTFSAVWCRRTVGFHVLTLQATGAPGLRANTSGTAGACGLYKFVRRNRYNAYAGIGGGLYVREDVVLSSSSVTVETDLDWIMTAVVGADTAVGEHFGLSGEGGVGDGMCEDPLWLPFFGVGFYYYW